MDIERRLLRLEEIAEQVHVSTAEVRRLARRGAIPVLTFGRNTHRFRPADIPRIRAIAWGENTPEQDARVAQLEQQQVAQLETVADLALQLSRIEHRLDLVLEFLEEMPRRKSLPPSVRTAVYTRNIGTTRHRGVKTRYGTRQIDHVIPVSQNGSDELDNLVTACRACNMRKRAMLPIEAGMPLLAIGTTRQRRK